MLMEALARVALSRGSLKAYAAGEALEPIRFITADHSRHDCRRVTNTSHVAVHVDRPEDLLEDHLEDRTDGALRAAWMQVTGIPASLIHRTRSHHTRTTVAVQGSRHALVVASSHHAWNPHSRYHGAALVGDDLRDLPGYLHTYWAAKEEEAPWRMAVDLCRRVLAEAHVSRNRDRLMGHSHGHQSLLHNRGRRSSPHNRRGRLHRNHGLSGHPCHYGLLGHSGHGRCSHPCCSCRHLCGRPSDADHSACRDAASRDPAA
mmetsp:Transcript_126462/g.236406  ORF Transcript_126462/g.236406 Transcript_126462/m.236406 type:complete len:260 (-) Transcript_126462:2674-3453(-)